jgi:hypothetical protein
MLEDNGWAQAENLHGRSDGADSQPIAVDFGQDGRARHHRPHGCLSGK